MSEVQMDSTIRMDRTIPSALSMAVIMSLREYVETDCNYADIFSEVLRSSISSYDSLSDDDRVFLGHFIEIASSRYGSESRLPSENSVVDVRSIFGSLIYNQVLRKLPEIGKDSYISFVTTLLVSKRLTCSLVRQPEAFEFILRAFILYYQAVKTLGYKSIVESYRLFNELSMNPRLLLDYGSLPVQASD